VLLPPLLALGVMLALPLLPVERWRSPAVPVLAVGFSLASIAWAGGYHKELRARHADALSGLDAPLRIKGARLPIVLSASTTPFATIFPFATSAPPRGALCRRARGLPPYLFAGALSIHAFRHRPEAWKAFPQAPDLNVFGRLAVPALSPSPGRARRHRPARVVRRGLRGRDLLRPARRRRPAARARVRVGVAERPAPHGALPGL